MEDVAISYKILFRNFRRVSSCFNNCITYACIPISRVIRVISCHIQLRKTFRNTSLSTSNETIQSTYNLLHIYWHDESHSCLNFFRFGRTNRIILIIGVFDELWEEVYGGRGDRVACNLKNPTRQGRPHPHFFSVLEFQN